ncbi:hypothetical protein FO440_20790 [Mucilaginibacter corticis]|uniref:Uncharacterized protein n=1 Tax=Mucilaginibacter corticis TaxID=2597670 RepID=A0A556MBM7_9SPHI|nr:hypothetical protein [Mucilaginibacter corticis]TSJ37205.1 hypothetical protein FO440_20790 [Mucilaginibacter corticis]
MLYKEDEIKNDRDNHSEESKPNAYRVDNETKEEKSEPAKQTKPVREGRPMGGQNFGSNNVTPAGDDKNNPSQNAGYTNEYFRRTEPAEEHTESNNFKSQNQEGRSDYDKATSKEPHPAKNGDKPQPKQGYEEGTADNDGKNNAEPNIPGANELPDQQKVGE